MQIDVGKLTTKECKELLLELLKRCTDHMLVFDRDEKSLKPVTGDFHENGQFVQVETAWEVGEG